MIKSATGSHTKTFDVDIQPIEYIWPDQIAEFTARHCRDGQLVRVVGSDSLIEFINNQRFWPVLGLCHYAVVVRKMAGLEQVETAIAGLPDAVRARLSYEIVGFHQAPHEARKVRQDLDESYRQRLVKPGVFNYAKRHHLY